MRPAPSNIDGASTKFTCICARATRGDHGEGGRWRVQRDEGGGKVGVRGGGGGGWRAVGRAERSRQNVEAPASRRHDEPMVRAEEDGVAVCTGLIAGHRSTDVPMRERVEGGGRERESKRERVGRAKGETEDSLADATVCARIRRTIMGEYLIGWARDDAINPRRVEIARRNICRPATVRSNCSYGRGGSSY